MLNLKEIRNILNSRALDSFVGLKENSWFDAKRAWLRPWNSEWPDRIG